MLTAPHKLGVFASQSAKTLIEARRPDSRIKNKQVRKSVQAASREAFKSLAYAFLCLGGGLALFCWTSELPPGIKILAGIIGCVFAVRLLAATAIGYAVVAQGNRELHSDQKKIYLLKEFDHPLLLYFWIECQCDPEKFPLKFEAL